MSIGSIVEELISVHPKAKTKRLISETKVMFTLVGTSEAPGKDVTSTPRLFVTPADAFQ